jgi:hypothetical protein
MIIRSAKELIVYKRAHELAITALDFAGNCGYITPKEHKALTTAVSEIGKMLGAMIRNPGGFIIY